MPPSPAGQAQAPSPSWFQSDQKKKSSQWLKLPHNQRPLPPPLSPCGSLNSPGTFSPQGLCTCWSFRLECSSPPSTVPHSSLTYVFCRNFCLSAHWCILRAWNGAWHTFNKYLVTEPDPAQGFLFEHRAPLENNGRGQKTAGQGQMV